MSPRPESHLRLLSWTLSAHRVLVAVLLALAVGVAVCEISIPWLLQQAVDVALGERENLSLDMIGGAMLAVIVVLYVLHAVLLRVETRVWYDGIFRLRQRLYATLIHQPLAFFSRKKLGELQHRVMNDTEVFEDHGVHLFSDLPFDLLTVTGVLTIMFLTNVKLAAIAVGFLVIAWIISIYVGRPLPTLQKSMQNIGALLNSRLHESLAGIRAVKSFGREQYEVARMDEASREIVDLEVKGGKVESYLVPIFDLMELLGVVVVVWYAAHLIMLKQITPGTLVAFLAYMEILAGPVSHAEKYYRHFQKFRAVSERIGHFLQELDPLPSVINALPVPTDLFPLVFDDTGFTYPGNDKPTLQRLSFTVNPGEIIAVVGKNGAGKSTLMDLLLGFQKPSCGRILVGAKDLRQWDGAAWRRAVGFMSQEVFLIHGTVAENIAYGRPQAGLAEIETAARQAGLESLINRLAQGLQTIVGDRGSRLSGGERQRIALARLFLNDPRLLIFDEPTAHLDAGASREVVDIIARLAGGRTVFLISHRPDVLKLANRIILLDGGSIIADGAPDFLEKNEPLYRVLALEAGRDSGPSSVKVSVLRG
ncbi:MAG: ABC transporter ATP-binding protein [Gammaproteobacteria bacterium]|nr:ABC transporter ATP-binding protein [Gammaproteobacteria bacterium]